MHSVIYKDRDGNLVSISMWRYRPLNAREAIELYDLLCDQPMSLVVRYEGTTAVESRAGKETNVIHSYLPSFRSEDGSVWIKWEVPSDS